ncbi:hypothetical protein BG011_004211 [Mortierella polycephala]|uniref:Choline kinase n=1 Tax=Mortierella polycephala TaxID=41804 RepID=A0A9P6U315_9FUNG|nr:hypothetical protein BG011_004211 [Mortierella polycephala]
MSSTSNQSSPSQDHEQPDHGRDIRETPRNSLNVDNDNDNDNIPFQLEASWQDQPLRLPAYTPSSAAKQTSQDSFLASAVDDPIYQSGSKKHFGFSSRQSIASSIFPWQKHKPAVCHQYAPHRPPLSKRPSLAGLKVMPAAQPEPVKHLDEEEIDLLALKGDQLPQRVLELLHKMDIQDWAEVTDYKDLRLDRISGAMTNCIFLVIGPSRAAATNNDSAEPTEPKPRKVLLRVYGIGLEALFSRSNELHWLHNLSTMDIGPSLLGIFKNGRFEQYVESTTLTKEDIRNPRTSRHIAHRMCELHNIVNVFPPPEGTIPQTQVNIAKWIPLAQQAIEMICVKDPAKKAIMDEFDFEKLLKEIDEVHKELMTVHSPLVFAHNDTQYGNILRTMDENEELIVIDFEYAGYNTRGFDIGNHFCEWTADYHSDRPSILHPCRYPTRAEQLNFLEAYMEAEIAMCGYHLTAINLAKYAKKRQMIAQAITKGLEKVALTVNAAVSHKKEAQTEFPKEEQATTAAVEEAKQQPTASTTAKGNSAIENEAVKPRKDSASDDGGGVSKAEILDSMYKEVNKFALASHIMWGLWGLIQATQSEIDFDYFEYALQRLTEFRNRRDEFMAL